MIENTRSRLMHFMQLKGLTTASFEKFIGASNGSVAQFLSGKNKGLGNNLEKILTSFKNLNPQWLFYGSGPVEIDFLSNRLGESNESCNKEGKSGDFEGKSGQKPVIYSQSKTSDLRGDLIEKSKNEKYIKPYAERDVPVSQVHEASEVYGATDQAMRELIMAQNKLFEAFLARIEHLEALVKALTDHHT